MREFAFANERRPDSGAVKEVRDATSDPHFFRLRPLLPQSPSLLLSCHRRANFDQLNRILYREFEQVKLQARQIRYTTSTDSHRGRSMSVKKLTLLTISVKIDLADVR